MGLAGWLVYWVNEEWLQLGLGVAHGNRQVNNRRECGQDVQGKRYRVNVDQLEQKQEGSDQVVVCRETMRGDKQRGRAWQGS